MTKTLPTKLGRSSLMAETISPAGISEHRRSRRTASKLCFSIIASAWLGIVGNVAFASQSRQQNVEDVADGGFVLDDENIAKLVAVVQSILSEVG